MIKNQISLEGMRKLSENTLAQNLGIELLEISEGKVKASMPVDHRTIQPFGILHGGASVALAETLGSMGSSLYIDHKTQQAVGLEINANHVKAVKSGEMVFGVAQPLHLGKRTQIWEIKITNKDEQLVCISRITIAVIDKL